VVVEEVWVTLRSQEAFGAFVPGDGLALVGVAA
jgi:hypothetical protein